MNWLRRRIIQWLARGDGLDGISLIDCKYIFIANSSDIELAGCDMHATNCYIRVNQAVIEGRQEEKKEEAVEA